jgi:hypothetical protein
LRLMAARGSTGTSITVAELNGTDESRLDKFFSSNPNDIRIRGNDQHAGAVSINSSEIPYHPLPGLPPPLPLPGIAEARFAMGLGGGADVTVSGRIAIRVVQLDYIPMRTRPYWTHNVRIMSGIVFRF